MGQQGVMVQIASEVLRPQVEDDNLTRSEATS
jgi:hypothetical protein